ncbi:MAG: hypothetical protein EBV10_02645 [Synechococcaceae bacterium WB6_1A_059]|nr:hypothetical protein [Synechococcaceae bacterium WB6_1A_059]
MIYLSFNVPQKYFPLRTNETEEWNKVGKKFDVQIIPVTPWALYLKNELPMGVYNMVGPVNTSHFRFLKHLENHGVKYINDIENSSKADDKFLCALECNRHHISTPKNIDLNLLGGVAINLKGEIADLIGDKLGYPCVLKYPNAGYGQGHILIKNKSEFNDIYGLISLTNGRFGVQESCVDFFVQEYIKPPKDFLSHGIRALVWKNEIINVYLKKSKIGWKSNIAGLGEFFGIMPIEAEVRHFSELNRSIDKELEFLTKKIIKIFNLKFAAVDFYETHKGYILEEVNTCPGIFSNNPEFSYFGNSKFNPYEEIVKELIN